ncbi:MAG: hypothetical protein A2283_22070 [Lentisphaerae bacterium RIFOXYA12_FULL_48_11]|nr:MAG: hypothetical protein A2283_22070 [Lentisphaerae bacterium RIFOXYA12_FULL_48_11]
MNDLKEIFGECISVYTRAQAIEDGVLVDVSETASEAGFKWPVAVTRAVYDRYVEVPEELEGQQDIQGRGWDLVYMLWVNIRNGKINGGCGNYTLLVRMPETEAWQDNERREPESHGLRLVTLKAVSGPDDNGDPVITVMLPRED